MAYLPLVVKVGAAHCAATTISTADHHHGTYFLLNVHMLLAGRIDTTSRPDAVPLLCFVVSAYAMHAYSLSCKAFVVGEIHSSPAHVCHVPSAGQEATAATATAADWDVMFLFSDATFTRMYYIYLYSQQSTELFEDSTSKSSTTIDFLLLSAAPQIRKLTQTRALHTRAAIIRVTQLNSTKPNQELYSRYQPLLQQIHPPSYNG